MSNNYYPPSAKVQSEFAALSGSIIQPQNVVLVGPQKLVYDINTPADAPYFNYGAYDPADGNTLDYLGSQAGAVVDTSSVKLFLGDLLGTLAELSGAGVIQAGVAPNSINIPSANGFQAFTNANNTSYLRNTAFKNRDVQVGDRLKIVAGGHTLNTRITAFINDVVAANVASPVVGSNNPVTQSYSGSVTPVNVEGTDHVATIYTGVTTFNANIAKGYLNDVYTLTCTLGGAPGTATFSVTSVKGDNVLSLTSVAFGTAFNVGSLGLQAKIASTGSQNFVAGEVYTFTVAAAYTQSAPARVTASSVFAGTQNLVYTITVVKGGVWSAGPQVIVTSNTGVDQSTAQIVSYNTPFALGSLGATVKFSTDLSAAQNGLLLGDTYTVTVTAAAQGAVRTALLANPLDPAVTTGTDLDVTFYIYKAQLAIPATGYPEFGDTNLVANAENFVVSAELNISDPSWTDVDGITLLPIPVASATILATYSALLTANANIVQTISDPSVISAIASKVIPANPMGYGLAAALAFAGGQPVYFIPVESDDLAGYTAALGAHEASGAGYFVVPLSNDPAVIGLTQTHVDNMCAVAIDQRCMGVAALPNPKTKLIYNLQPNTNPWLGYVSIAAGTDPAQYTMVHLPAGTFITDGVRPGDTLFTNFSIDSSGNPTYQTAVINSITDEQNLVLVAPGFSAPVGDSTHLQKMQISRTFTLDELAANAATAASAFNDRLFVNVVPNIPLNPGVCGYIVAAAFAGLMSSVAPHQPLSTYTMSGFFEGMVGPVTRFTPTQLNVIAAGGNTIIAQNGPNGAVFVRHALTTNNLDDFHAEISMTRNCHSVEQQIESDLKPLAGKYNSTNYLLQLLDVTVRNRMNLLQSTTVTLSAGPQVTDWDPSTLEIARNPVSLTSINIGLSYDGPLPANTINALLTVSAAGATPSTGTSTTAA